MSDMDEGVEIGYGIASRSQESEADAFSLLSTEQSRSWDLRTVHDEDNIAGETEVVFYRKSDLSDENTDDMSSFKDEMPLSPTHKSEINGKPTFTQRWVAGQHAICKPIHVGLVAVSLNAARHPRKYVLGIILFTLGIVATGYFTNFNIENDDKVLWKPRGSQSEADGHWVDDEWEDDEPEEQFQNVSRFLQETENRTRVRGRSGQITVFLHKGGENIVNVEGQRRNFDIVDFIQAEPEYTEHCAAYGQSSSCPPGYEFICQFHGLPWGDDLPSVCQIAGPTAFWLNNSTLYEKLALSDMDVRRQLSADVFPGEFDRFNIKNVIGYAEFSDDGTIMAGQSYLTIYSLDRSPGAKWLERDLLKEFLRLKDEWENDPDNDYRFEVIGSTSVGDEVERSILNDLPLVPIVFVIMCVFTCIAFAKKDWVHSRSLLGFGAVSCVLLSILTGYGFMWLIGVPFTTLSQVLPFILFGIGLDDAFILINAYARTDANMDAVERVHDTMNEVGMSIFMTTATSVLAFGLGCISSLPAIRWLCLYAFPMIAIDFFYQITFFVALIVIDEKRVHDKRRDCLVCFRVKNSELELTEEEKGSKGKHENDGPGAHAADRVMTWYADKLLRRWVKGFVVVAFLGLLGACAYSASQLRLAFDFTDLLSSDSYVIPFFRGIYDYAEAASISPNVYFRNVNHSDPAIHVQMEEYVKELVDMKYITAWPANFWLDDYNVFLAENEVLLRGLSFDETLDLFLSDEQYERYGDDFVFNGQGGVKASRTLVDLNNFDQTDVNEMLDVLHTQRRIGSEQPVNQQGGNWSFFTFHIMYHTWEFLSVIVDELKLTAILGITAVSVMAGLLLPHWSGILFVGPLVTVLYIDLMGVLHFAGVTLDGVAYVSLTMSIGLLVDFIMHVGHSYFTSSKIGRQEKTRDVLQTMGASILLGGLSTFLGTLPLAFASIGLFRTFFITFAGTVLLGLAHGLILFPVLLSLVGPE